jgi:hypothetical protein
VAWPKAKGGKDQEQKSYPGGKSANFQQKGPHEFPHAAQCLIDGPRPENGLSQ